MKTIKLNKNKNLNIINNMNLKGIRTAAAAIIIMLALFTGAGAQSPHKLTATNITVAGNEVQFDVYMQASTATPVYLSVSDLVLSFNSVNFENPVFSYISSSGTLKNSLGAPATAYNEAITQYVSGNMLVINIPEVEISTQADFNSLVARIDNQPMTHKIGRFSISGITNPGGMLGLQWDEAKTIVQLYEPVKWAAVFSSELCTYEVSEDQPLPVELQSFTAANVNTRNVKLTWITATETNNAGFEVQRAVKGEQLTDYKTVGYLSGKGTTTTPTTYTYEDVKLNTGKYNYRLKQIDNNGHFTYFSLNSEVEVGIPKKFNLSQNYPNPFNPVTKIDFDLPQDTRVRIVIYDILGREMKSIVNEFRKAGYHTVTFSADNFSSGTYFYRLDAEGTNIMTKKMVILK